MSLTKSCRQCTTSFEISDSDLAFFDKVSPVFNGVKKLIPPPTLCADCRRQRRLAFRNERKLYRRKCDLSGKQIISMYSEDKPVKVYDREVWWSEKFNPLDYGRDYDFNKTFFEQFQELLNVVPRLSLNNKEPENSEYCNFALQNKNCYLIFTSGNNENSYYSNRSFKLIDCADCSNCNESELCYQLTDCQNCYNSKYLQNSNNCNDCILGYNLRGCHDCFACYNLNNAKFCIGNVQYSEEDYRKKVAELMGNLDEERVKFEEEKKKAIRKYINGSDLDNCTGDALFNSRNSFNCFEAKNIQDCNFVCNATNMKDSEDVTNDDNSELVYEAIGSEKNYMHAFNDICWFNNNDYYNSLCFNSNNNFGCTGLKKNSYCILNKQYTKEEYEILVPKIIDQMISNGEWGEFFPIRLSLFAYNETMAQEFFPLKKEDVEAIGSTWKEPEEKAQTTEKFTPPANINDVTGEITKHILTCEKCSNNYKIIPQELELYKKIGTNIPKLCPDCRHKERFMLRNPRHLYTRECARCSMPIVTSYSPERSETVYCEKCYLETVG